MTTTTTPAPQAEAPAAEKAVRVVVKEQTESVYLVPVSRLPNFGLSDDDTHIEDENDLVVGLLEDFEPDEYSVRERTSTIETN